MHGLLNQQIGLPHPNIIGLLVGVGTSGEEQRAGALTSHFLLEGRAHVAVVVQLLAASGQRTTRERFILGEVLGFHLSLVGQGELPVEGLFQLEEVVDFLKTKVNFVGLGVVGPRHEIEIGFFGGLEEKMRARAGFFVLDGGPGFYSFEAFEDGVVFGRVEEGLGGFYGRGSLYSVEIVEVKFLDFPYEVVSDVCAGGIVYPHHS